MRCLCLAVRKIPQGLCYTSVFALVGLIVHQAILPLLGYLFPSLTPAFFELAVYGIVPTSDFHTFTIPTPAPNDVAWDESCGAGHILIAPYGSSLPDGGPLILEPNGNLVWTPTHGGNVINLNVQTYHAEAYLTYWAGKKVGGSGHGKYYMLNSSYDIVHTVSAVSPPDQPDSLRHGDLHEFLITPSGTALVTVYSTTTADLRAVGRSAKGYIVDSLFQEIDIETNALLFEWSASDHFDPATTSEYIDPFGGYTESWPYDFFHINSVQKDRKNNYLISSRHLHSIMTVSGVTGQPLWILGGAQNQFTDLSSGQATNFAWQHHARWVDEEAGILSLFDNGSAGPIMTSASESRGMLIQIDTEQMTVTLLTEYTGQSPILSASQGSVQVFDALPSPFASTLSLGANASASRSGDEDEGEDHRQPHVLVGWGSSAAFSEYTLAGSLLCEVHFAASVSFWLGLVKSYRAMKTFDWVGRPREPPAAIIDGGKVFVSWNGATEVRSWQLEGHKDDAERNEGWQVVDVKVKEAFEDMFVLGPERFEKYRVAALNAEGEVMRYSDVVMSASSSAVERLWGPLFSVCVIAGGLGGARYWLRKRTWRIFCGRWPRHRRGYSNLPDIEME